MTVNAFHTLIEQDVQKISSFAYEDLLPQEIDIQANKTYYEWLETFANLQPQGNRMDDTEARLNEIRTLVVRDFSLSPVVQGGVSVALLPSDYLYLVGIRMTTYSECNKVKVKSIEPNSYYILKSSSLVYNGNTYTQGDLIQGQSSYLLGKSDILYKLEAQTVRGRIVRNEDVYPLADHYYGRTNAESPIVYVHGNTISIETDNFFALNVKVAYIKEPTPIDSSNPDTELELPEAGCYKLAKLTVVNILKVTEQPQQKIVNLN